MKTLSAKWLVPIALLILVLSQCGFAQSSNSFEITWSSLSSGGGQGLTSNSFAMEGTLGQSVAGYAESNSFAAYIGFWVPEETNTPPTEINSLDEAKTQTDGTKVHTTGKVATSAATDFTGFIYVEESDRSSGIRVVAQSITGALVRGSEVEVTGTMSTTTNGERFIDNATVIVTGSHTLLAPLGMNNKGLGGGDLGVPATGTGQYGVSGGVGTNNIGLLVKVWGYLTSSGGATSLDDGSGTVVTVDTTDITVPSNGYYSITGISSLESDRAGVVMPRDNGDVRPH